MAGRRFDMALARLWFPVYILIGLSWLVAPSLAHEQYGTLRLISNDEALRSGVVFRIGDVSAALLLLLAVWRFGVWRRSRWVGGMVAVAALLAAVDGLFPDTCYIGHQACSVVATAISGVHDGETILLGGVVAALSVADALRRRRAASVAFVVFQVCAGLLLLAGVVSNQAEVVLQYIYETMVIVWLGWLVDGYAPLPERAGPGRAVRLAAGVWAVLAGVLAITTALPHLHFVQEVHVRGLRLAGLLLEQHGIIVGVLLLYVARHLLRGERPALWLAIVLVYSQIIKYSLLTPHLGAVVLSTVVLALLVYARRSFDRNTQAPSWASRLSDVGMVLAGVAAALLLALAVATVAGQRTHLLRDVTHLYDYPHRVFTTHTERVSERTEARLRVLTHTLAISLGAVTLWSLFRPRSIASSEASRRYGRNAMARLLRRYSNSTEDYFKLWPDDKSYFVEAGGAVAYRVAGGIAFALADPIAPDVDRLAVLQAFVRFARSHGWVACVLVIGGKRRDIYEAAGLQTMQIGSSAVIDVTTFCNTTARTKWWRWQRNRAARSGWQYERLAPPHSAAIMDELRHVSDVWLGEKGRSEQGFALGYFDDAYLQGCAVHTLRDAAGRLIAFANELPVFGGVRQASVDLIRYLPDQDGAMPVLLMHAIERLNGTRFTGFNLGFVPLAQVDNELARLLRRVSANRFSAQGLEQFKNKFDPTWLPDYVAYDGDLIDLARIAANLEQLFRVDRGPNRSAE